MIRFMRMLGGISLILALSACSSIGKQDKVLSISGAIEVPIVVDAEKYWVDSGPLFIVSKAPLITFRVIDKEEIRFVGSEKSVYEFFVSSFSTPSGIAEEAFRNSHNDYKLNKIMRGGLTIYTLTKSNESKAYIVSKSMHFCLEVSAGGETSDLLFSNIINKARLTTES